jgi:serine/threonine-protein kinase TTK/MPS1
VADVWLSYASCQLASGLIDDARMSLRHVQQILLAAPSSNNNNIKTGEGGGLGGGPRWYPAEQYVRLANLLVRAGSSDGAIQALEAGMERHREDSGVRAELSQRLALLRPDPTRTMPQTPSVDAIPALTKKRRTPLSSLPLSPSDAIEPKRGRTEDAPPFAPPSEHALAEEATPLDLQALKRRPLTSLQSSKPVKVMNRSTSDDVAGNGPARAPPATLSHRQHQQRLSLRAPAKPSNVPLLPKLSAYSSSNAGRRSSSPSTFTTATEASEVESVGGTLRPGQPHGSEDAIRHWATPTTTATGTTTEERISLLNQSSETVTDSGAPTFRVLGGSGIAGGASHQRSHGAQGDKSNNSNSSITETTPSRPPLGQRGVVLATGGISGSAPGAAVGQPTSASRHPTLLDRISRGGGRGALKPRMDWAQSASSDNDNGSQGPVHEPKDGGIREEESTTRSSNGDDSKSPPRKVNMDISYMWEWDPNKLARSAADATPDSPNASTKLTQPSKLEPIKEDEAAAPPSSSKQGVVLADSKHRDASRENSRAASSEPEPAVTAPPLSEAEAAALLQTCSRDFLPLMSEANVLRVNSVPYLKLGVIGKGGSCKVYRALTKNCSVVAIKKVKLAGMERNAISGYANEVALLKRLRGNPAIIQMIDSQLDLKRKQLLVVMEQGETDLNHVLHQQALSGATRGQERHRQLNMNFIRLTWHQMLSAVHCIHEARIVHGDLKPANFLFVKGALKLIDFGIAKAIQSEDTTNVYRDTQIGTLNYMSPEAIAADSGATQRNGAPRMKVGRVRQSAGLVPAEMF